MHTATHIHHTDEGDSLIALMARVSNPSNQSNTKTSSKLIRYLIDHQHWSPFEMVSMCVSIHTTRSIAAQLIRHRSFSFQEYSLRYSTVQDKPVNPHLRRQDLNNKQNSIDDFPEQKQYSLDLLVNRHMEESLALYDLLISKDVAKECARDVLPMAAPTRLYMHGTLRSWIHYCQLRTSQDTQLEHRQIAQQCFDLIEQCFPMTYDALL